MKIPHLVDLICNEHQILLGTQDDDVHLVLIAETLAGGIPRIYDLHTCRQSMNMA
jgi:hypothetical protein